MGGSEGLRRLRELIEEGFNIQARQHPDKHRAVWQYRFVVDQPVSPIRRSDDGYTYVPQPSMKVEVTPEEENTFKFTKLPAKIDFGAVAVCPRCRARTQKYLFKGKHDKLHKDPVKEKTPCIGCNGWGIVPNIGPIPMTSPEGMK